MGSITLNVEEPIETEQDREYFFILAGTQELSGDEALAYTRCRGGPTADIGCIGRQQRFSKLWPESFPHQGSPSLASDPTDHLAHCRG